MTWSYEYTAISETLQVLFRDVFWREIYTPKFQSTPPRGGRPDIICSDVVMAEFQSTPPRGGRPNLMNQDHNNQSVSIHAPAWGATQLDESGP